MNTRWFAIPIAAALLATACGGDDKADPATNDGGQTAAPAGNAANCPVEALASASGPVEINMWYAFQGVAAQGLDQMAADYNASQSKVVIKVSNQGNYEEQLTKYKTALAAPDTLPALMTAEDTQTRFLLDSKSIVTAEDCLAADPDAKDLYADLVPAVEAAYTVDGQLLPVGFGVSNPVLYFNRTQFTTAGLNPEQPPATLAELRSAAEKLKAAAIPGLEEPLVLKMDSWFIEHWVTGEKTELVDQDNGRAGPPSEALIDSPEVAEVTAWIKGMIDDELLKAVRSNDDISAYLAVATQSGAMLIETSAAITTIDAAIAGTLDASILPQAAGLPLEDLEFGTLDAGVAAMPGVKAAGKGQIGGNAWYIAKKSPEQIAAAWDFIKFANSKDAQVKWTSRSGYLPSHQQAAEDPALQSEWTSSRKGGWLKTAYASILSLDPEFTGPLIGAYPAFRTEARSALDAIAFEGADPTARFAEAKTKVDTAFAEYAKNPGQ